MVHFHVCNSWCCLGSQHQHQDQHQHQHQSVSNSINQHQHQSESLSINKYRHKCSTLYIFTIHHHHHEESVWLDGDSRWNSSIQVLDPFCVDRLSSQFRIKFPPAFTSLGEMDLAFVMECPAIST